MITAYINCDSAENPSRLNSLHQYLISCGVYPKNTTLSWKGILKQGNSSEPFIYFRHAYLHYPWIKDLADFIRSNKDIPYVLSKDGEVVAGNTLRTGPPFILNCMVEACLPPTGPLPILLGTHRRSTYLQLTLNSLMRSLHDPGQQVVVVASAPDVATQEVLHQSLKKYPCLKVVETADNLRYAFANFGSKFYHLNKFIHWEDDGIVPEHLHYHIPYWTAQLNYRADTADVVAFRTYEGNYSSDFYRCQMMHAGQILPLPFNPVPTTADLWYYTEEHHQYITPIGGNGIVIDTPRMYKNFREPDYKTSDHNILGSAKRICIVNLPVYHIGANMQADYPEYCAIKASGKAVPRYCDGLDLISGRKTKVDLGMDYA